MLSPGQESVECWAERLPPLGEVILDLRRNLCVHDAADNAVLLQLSELLRQHLLRDAINRALQVGKAKRLAAKEMKEDHELPATFQHATEVELCMADAPRSAPLAGPSPSPPNARR
jgi:hypothetical protein